MLDVAAALGFLAFVTAGVRLWKTGLSAEAYRRRVNVFLAVILMVSFAAGLGQRDLWPFSSWPLVAGTLDDEITQPRMVAVDADGAEHDVDVRAWQPLSFDELMSWMDLVFPTLDADARSRAAAHLVGLAERARLRAVAGEPIGSWSRYLGPLTAPTFILHPYRWSDRSKIPARELTGLRFYHETWSLSARARGAHTLRRQLVFRYPAE
jgi:hypothetical protein